MSHIAFILIILNKHLALLKEFTYLSKKLIKFNNKIKNDMKRLKTLLLATAALLCSIAVQAYDFKVDSICYQITSEEELTVAVTYQGSTYLFDENNYSGSLTIPATVTNDGKAYKVTSIAAGAFYNCKNITDITIPNSVTRIEDMSFFGCSGIKSIVLHDSLEYIGGRAFNSCSSLNEINFPKNDFITIVLGAFDGTAWFQNHPNGMIYISNHLYCYKGEITSDTTIVIADGTRSILGNAFSSSRTTPEKIKGIIIPNSVTTIGAYAFQNCSSIESITIPDAVTTIANYTFAGCYDLEEIIWGNGITSIGSYAFKECGSLESITMPEALESIGDYAFQECSALASITLGKNMKSVGKKAFADCYCLEEIVVKGTLENIGEEAFDNTAWYDSKKEGLIYIDNILYGYKGDMPEGTTFDVKEGTLAITNNAFKGTSIKAITLPSSLKIIGNYAFQNCTNLGNITLPAGLSSIGNYAFSGCTSITEVVLPDSLENLGNYAFADCADLEHIEFGKGITSIGNYTFRNCTRITEINIPDNITKIGSYTFQACKINTLTFGRGVKEIGSHILYNCTSIVGMYMMCETPPTLEAGLFSSSGHYKNGTLYVPKGTLEAYKAHKIWGQFLYIQEHDLTAIDNITTETPTVAVTAGGIMVNGAEGKEVSVYNIVGTVVERTSNYTGETIMLDKGVYIVRVGNKATKVRL
jgi:hypothetical protein